MCEFWDISKLAQIQNAGECLWRHFHRPLLRGEGKKVAGEEEVEGDEEEEKEMEEEKVDEDDEDGI